GRDRPDRRDRSRAGTFSRGDRRRHRQAGGTPGAGRLDRRPGAGPVDGVPGDQDRLAPQGVLTRPGRRTGRARTGAASAVVSAESEVVSRAEPEGGRGGRTAPPTGRLWFVRRVTYVTVTDLTAPGGYSDHTRRRPRHGGEFVG